MLLLLVTLTSVLLAAVMTAIAWRVSYDERRRSDARVAALAADIHGGLRMRAPAERPPVASASAPPDGAHLFQSPAADRGFNRIAVAIGAGVLVLAGFLAAVWMARPHSTAVVSASTPPPAAAAAPTRAPLELVALAHERDGDQLIVRGVVRNPADAPEVDKLTAVVFVFAQDGAFVASSRAAVTSQALTPGAESTFLVTIPGARDVSRYRVSFRTDDAIVPHVDRRERPQEKG